MQFNLETDRLLIRPIKNEDAQSVFLYRSDRVANRFQGWIPDSVEDVNHFINQHVSREINSSGTWFQFVLLLKAENKIIGDAGLYFQTSNSYEVETGLTLDKNYQGKGLASEALQQIIHFLFSDLHKTIISASVDPRNLNSIRLLEKLGFEVKAHFLKRFQLRGEWVDDMVYQIAKKDWACNK